MGLLKRRNPGRHRRDDVCVFTWKSRHVIEGTTFTTHLHRCGLAVSDKQAKQCDGEHVCRDWNCNQAMYDPSTAINQ